MNIREIASLHLGVNCQKKKKTNETTNLLLKYKELAPSIAIMQCMIQGAPKGKEKENRVKYEYSNVKGWRAGCQRAVH